MHRKISATDASARAQRVVASTTAITAEVNFEGTVHTAFEIKESMFTVTVTGNQTPRDQFLDWEARDRFGVIARSPYGALNAGLLALLCVSAFYDAPRQKRRMRPLYPPIYLFHVGGRWGFTGEFDFWPDRKEIFTSADPDAVLQAVNSHAITHLALPDGMPRDYTYRYKEPEEAIDRIKQCYVYGSEGSPADADVMLESSSKEVLENFERTINLRDTLTLREKPLVNGSGARAESAALIDERRYAAQMRARIAEVSPDDTAANQISRRLRTAIAQGRLVEQLRRVDVKTALRLLT